MCYSNGFGQADCPGLQGMALGVGKYRNTQCPIRTCEWQPPKECIHPPDTHRKPQCRSIHQSDWGLFIYIYLCFVYVSFVCFCKWVILACVVFVVRGQRPEARGSQKPQARVQRPEDRQAAKGQRPKSSGQGQEVTG